MTTLARQLESAPVPQIGQGTYSVPEVARLLRLPLPKMRRWLAGLQPEDDLFTMRGIQSEEAGFVEEQTLNFSELMEMQVVAMFRSSGVSMLYVRAIVRRASKEFDAACPFVAGRFATDGKRILGAILREDVEQGSRGRYGIDYSISQVVFDTLIGPFLSNLVYDSDGLRLFRPLGPYKPVVLDPSRSFGKPIDEQSGVQTLTLYNMIRAGEPIERVEWWHEVSNEAVRAAVEYEESLRYKLAE